MTSVAVTTMSVARFLRVVVPDGAPGWRDEALCAQTGPEEFFPERGSSVRQAKAVCAGCSVRRPCLEYALGRDERFGVWGGMSEHERRRLKQERVA